MRMPLLALLGALLVLAPTAWAQDVNQCLPNPCENGGGCINQPYHYTCDCQPNYTGHNCERHCIPTVITATDTPGLIHSPKYPRKYPSFSTECWKVTAKDPSKVVSLTMMVMDIEEDIDCGADWLRIVAGAKAPATIDDGTKLCGDTLPDAPFRSPHGFYLEFISDVSFRGRGFQMEYKAIVGGCTNLIATDVEQTFTSPNYPSNYPDNMDVCWTIRSSDASLPVHLSVLQMDIEEGNSCQYDYLDILDGPSENDDVLDTLCGMYDNGPYRGTLGLSVDFHSDEMGNARGFQMTYKTETVSCTELIATTTTKSFSSPNYPYAYPKNAYECWQIRSEDSMHPVVKLWFDDLDVEDSEECIFDYVKVVAGISPTGSVLNRVCGWKSPAAMSSADGLYVEFASDNYSLDYPGFNIQFVATKP